MVGEKSVKNNTHDKLYLLFIGISLGIIFGLLSASIIKVITLKNDNHLLIDYITNRDNTRNENGMYIYYGKDIDNYLIYNNILFRIININKDGSVDIVLDDYINIHNKIDIDKYLEDYFLSEIDTSKLSKVIECLDLSCNKIDDSKYVRLLNEIDIFNSLNQSNSYLFEHDNYWLENNSYVKDNKIIKTKEDDIRYIRPVIRLDRYNTIDSGNGTKDDPYIIKDNSIRIGNYVKINNDLFTVYKTDNTSIYLASYDGLSKLYSVSNVLDMLNYLNDSLYNDIEYKKIINKKNYRIDDLNKELYISIMNIDDIKLNINRDNSYLVSIYDKDKNYVYGDNFVSNNNLVNKIRYTFNINKDLVNNGNGTKDDPYMVVVE